MAAIQDYFAELYVAGLLANAEWNVYFPHRDRGMDFVISKTGADGVEIIRPVQVKGKYPSSDKGNKATYGYVGKLNQVHPDMILAIPFFAAHRPGPALFGRGADGHFDDLAVIGFFGDFKGHDRPLSRSSFIIIWLTASYA